MIGAHGGLFAVRRALHRSPPDDIIDDMYVSLNVLADGHRVIQSNEFVGVEDAATEARDEFDPEGAGSPASRSTCTGCCGRACAGCGRGSSISTCRTSCCAG